MIPVSVAPVFRIAATDEVPQISGPTPQRWAHDWALETCSSTHWDLKVSFYTLAKPLKSATDQ